MDGGLSTRWAGVKGVSAVATGDSRKATSYAAAALVLLLTPDLAPNRTGGGRPPCVQGCQSTSRMTTPSLLFGPPSTQCVLPPLP